MSVLKIARKLAVISALLEGNSLRSISRVTNVHRTAIQDLLVAVGDRCMPSLPMLGIAAKKAVASQAPGLSDSGGQDSRRRVAEPGRSYETCF